MLPTAFVPQPDYPFRLSRWPFSRSALLPGTRHAPAVILGSNATKNFSSRHATQSVA